MALSPLHAPLRPLVHPRNGISAKLNRQHTFETGSSIAWVLWEPPRIPFAKLCESSKIPRTLSVPNSPVARRTRHEAEKIDNSNRQDRKQVSFSSTAPMVHTVPSHRQYSKHRRSMLWISPEEQQQSYARNVMEYQAENWDYRQVIEEEQFVLTSEGYLVHPVHVYGYLMMVSRRDSFPQAVACDAQGSSPLLAGGQNMKQHFCRVFSAQKRP